MTTTKNNGFRNSVTNLSWLAGFFDGEGCIYINPAHTKKTYKGKEYTYPDIQVILAQSGPKGLELMEAIQSEYQFGKITSYHGSKLTKQIPYMTRTSGKNAIKFLKLIEPFLLLKKEKANEAILVGEQHFGNE